MQQRLPQKQRIQKFKEKICGMLWCSASFYIRKGKEEKDAGDNFGSRYGKAFEGINQK